MCLFSVSLDLTRPFQLLKAEKSKLRNSKITVKSHQNAVTCLRGHVVFKEIVNGFIALPSSQGRLRTSCKEDTSVTRLRVIYAWVSTEVVIIQSEVKV